MNKFYYDFVSIYVQQIPCIEPLCPPACGLWPRYARRYYIAQCDHLKLVFCGPQSCWALTVTKPPRQGRSHRSLVLNSVYFAHNVRCGICIVPIYLRLKARMVKIYLAQLRDREIRSQYRCLFHINLRKIIDPLRVQVHHHQQIDTIEWVQMGNSFFYQSLLI